MNGYRKRESLAEDDEDQQNVLSSVAGNTEHKNLIARNDARHSRQTDGGNLLLWWCPINGLHLILLLEAVRLGGDTDDSTVGW